MNKTVTPEVQAAMAAQWEAMKDQLVGPLSQEDLKKRRLQTEAIMRSLKVIK